MGGVMRIVRIPLLTATVIFLLSGFTFAQISSGGEPVSFKRQLSRNVPVITMPEVDVPALLAEDEENAELDVPFRFGYPHDVDYGLDNSGLWETLDDGGKVWRLAIKCPGAYSINILYNRFSLPDGARFHLYTPDKRMVLGAFTSRNNKQHGKFATAPTKDNEVILEYYLPAGIDDRGDLRISRIVHGYKDVFFGLSKEEIDPTEHFGWSQYCNINVNCPEGEPWHNEVRSVVMTIVKDGTSQCSGVMVNNVREDLTPYLLTANHCLGGEDTWLVVFNYESPSCENIVGPGDMTLTGVTLLAHNDYSDFGLVELSEQPPVSYRVHYSGWSAVDVPSPSSVIIHHPVGDIKKISFDFDPVVSTDYFEYTGESHWQVGNWEEGLTEGGSSGGPLYDPQHHIVGQLHGGYHLTCLGMRRPDWFGKFSKSWDYGTTSETRLKDWLDPDNTGTLVLDGMDAECCVGLRGNADGDPDDRTDIMDLIYLVEWMWGNGPQPLCMEEADADGNGQTDAMDLVYLVAWFWESGPEPASCP